MTRIPWRQLVPRADSIIAAIWADPTITTKAQAKALLTGDLTDLIAITGLTGVELREVLTDWRVNGPRHIKKGWVKLNDENVINPESDTKIINAVAAYASNHGISALTALNNLEAAIGRLRETYNG